MDRMALNAALSLLSEERYDEEAASIIVDFALTLPSQQSPYSLSLRREKGGGSDVLTGQTNLGIATIRVDENTSWNKEFLIKKERIGHFKLWWRKRGLNPRAAKTADIMFRHYLDAAHPLLENPEFLLVFDLETRKPITFCKWERRWLHLGILHVYLDKPRAIYGTPFGHHLNGGFIIGF